LAVYWALFIFILVGASLEELIRWRSSGMLWVCGLMIALLIGLRFHVGADWAPYSEMFELTSRMSLSRAATLSDPAYFVLNWLVYQVGADLWLVNLVCGLIFSTGLIRFAQAQERPWLTLLVAVPYLIIVVAMGYTRQGVAIGIILAGITQFLRSGSTARMALYVLPASLFHKTAVVALPLIGLSSGRKRFIGLVLATAATYFLYSAFLSNFINKFIKDYIEIAYSSQGAGIRVAMNIVPAAIFFLNYRNMGFNKIEIAVWRNFSFAAFALLVLLWTVSSSTAVDRLALYVIPLQLAILPRSWKGRLEGRLGFVLVVLYSALVQFAWLTFAVHARFWVPYRFWPFE
jgi:hypothetical protein